MAKNNGMIEVYRSVEEAIKKAIENTDDEGDRKRLNRGLIDIRNKIKVMEEENEKADGYID